MEAVFKTLVDNAIDSDIEEFIKSNSDENGINTSKLLIGECIYRPQKSLNTPRERWEALQEQLVKTESITQEEDIEEVEHLPQRSVRILIHSSVRTPHNSFFVDIINRVSVGDAHGWTGIACTPNTGVCVEKLDYLSNTTDKSRMTLDEITDFIDGYNASADVKKKER